MGESNGCVSYSDQLARIRVETGKAFHLFVVDLLSGKLNNWAMSEKYGMSKVLIGWARANSDRIAMQVISAKQEAVVIPVALDAERRLSRVA